MRFTGKIGLGVLALVVSACATTTRMPVTDVPAGTYVLVEPASEEYNAVAINEGAYAVRIGNMTLSGQHWVDADGRLHLVDDTGECAGQESIWTYSYANNRITLDLVEDLCVGREIPSHMVYERS
ncbi:MAG: hypothetical protein ACREKM_08350 [Longimicrobiales bacterium]